MSTLDNTDPTTITDPTSTFSIITDQPDYSPGSTAVFTVNNINAGDLLTFTVTDLNGLPISGTNQPWTVTADVSGLLQTTWAVGLDAMGESFQVTVVDQTTGQVATAAFSDTTPIVPPSPISPSPNLIDLTASAADSGVDNGVIFAVDNVRQATGSGVFKPFVRIDSNQNTEQ